MNKATLRLRFNKLEEMLKQKVWTKQELVNYFYGITNKYSAEYISREREVREMIARLRDGGIPVISTSDKKGYWIATDYVTDYAEAKHSSNELHSRINKLQRRVKAIDDFCERAEKVV